MNISSRYIYTIYSYMHTTRKILLTNIYVIWCLFILVWRIWCSVRCLQGAAGHPTKIRHATYRLRWDCRKCLYVFVSILTLECLQIVWHKYFICFRLTTSWLEKDSGCNTNLGVCFLFSCYMHGGILILEKLLLALLTTVDKHLKSGWYVCLF